MHSCEQTTFHSTALRDEAPLPIASDLPQTSSDSPVEPLPMAVTLSTCSPNRQSYRLRQLLLQLNPLTTITDNDVSISGSNLDETPLSEPLAESWEAWCPEFLHPTSKAQCDNDSIIITDAKFWAWAWTRPPQYPLV
jgi:hypothetical protein